MSRFRTAAALCALLTLLPFSAGLVGCASVEVPPLPREVPAGWRQAPAEAANALAPDLRTWWKALADPRLDALVEQALAQNLTLAQARSRLRQARLLAGRDAMQYRPVLSASLRTLQDISATDTYFQASLDAVWELGLFGSRETAERSGQARLDSAIASSHAARVSTVAEVVRTYLDLRAAQHQWALQQRLAELDVRTLELLEVQLRQRLAAPDEQRQAEARLAQTRAQASQLHQAAEQAAQGLALLLGQAEPDAAWLAGDPPSATAPAQPVLGEFSLQQVPADLLRYRPEIRSAEAEVLKAVAELGSATAELYPRIALGASMLYAHNLTQHHRRITDNIPAIGPLIDIPLFDWGRRRAAADAQKEALDAALLAYRQALLEGVAEAERALGNLQLARERTQHLRVALAAMERRVEDQRTLVRLRLSSELARLSAERGALQSAMELASAEAGRTLAFVALYKSLGGAPRPADEEPAPRPAAAASGARP